MMKTIGTIHTCLNKSKYLLFVQNQLQQRCLSSQHSVEEEEVNLNSGHKPLHIPVMLQETIDSLNMKRENTFIDLTFGAGGHTEEILKRFPCSKVYALDRDERAIQIAQELSSKYKGRIIPVVGKMSEVTFLLQNMGLHGSIFDGAIIDAGCSSMQFDDGHRGFSLSKSGPLDMRMDGNRLDGNITAADVVNNLPEDDLKNIIKAYGDERNAAVIASCIVENRPIMSTNELRDVISSAFSSSMTMSHMDSIGRRRHIATKTFLALRIFVNDEMTELYRGIESVVQWLKPLSRLCVLSYHSSEDRVVIRGLRSTTELEDDVTMRIKYGNRRVWNDVKTYFPTPGEIHANPRSRSATLRVATKS